MVVYRTDSNGSSNYDATPKSVPTARRYPASPFSSWFSQGLTTHNISTVIAVVLFSILLFQYYSYDNSCELEQSGLRGLWREKKMEYENDMRRWEQERAANENQAKLDRRVKEMELESVTMRWEQERAASESQARLDWSAEEMKHERERERWELERTANRTQGRSDWDKEKLAHQNVREGWERERQKLAAENERVKEKWERERREREAQDKRAREKSVRDQWERDSEAKRAKEQWAKERQQWKAERKGWEKERAKYLPYFEEPILKDTHCRAFNTREYQARLWNIRLPGDNRWLEACMSTETTIRGQKFKSPHRCVDQVRNPFLFVLTGSMILASPYVAYS